jgi:hypothetical protein
LTVTTEFAGDDGVVRGVAGTVAGLGDTLLALREDPDAAAGVTGFDPIAFAVKDHDDLQAWITHLDQVGSPTPPSSRPRPDGPSPTRPGASARAVDLPEDTEIVGHSPVLGEPAVSDAQDVVGLGPYTGPTDPPAAAAHSSWNVRAKPQSSNLRMR